MATDLLVVTHPWAVVASSSSRAIPANARTWPGGNVFPLYINTQALRDLNGAVAIIPPASYVACAMSQSVLPSGTVLIDLHLFPAD